MELLPEYQRDLSALSLLYIRSRSGPLVPLASLATLGSSAGPLTVNHAGQLPSVTISFDLRDGVAIGTAVAQVQRVAQQVLPPASRRASPAPRRHSSRARRACCFC